MAFYVQVTDAISRALMPQFLRVWQHRQSKDYVERVLERLSGLHRAAFRIYLASKTPVSQHRARIVLIGRMIPTPGRESLTIPARFTAH